ncbi:hypothetical protein CC80DRAFT_592305 [Byssothecium circinans]|uniref:Uncharacterized protein n=1 Tax=Byssothecium circinans TaxID=147558 RepID=A0A6A5U0I9_9PLEO|nr:hypothetical protein CC80DRAFT_592305 [Byssothecium circinans]
MAVAGPDGLLDYLLSEVAICGVQGASSNDFCRFVDSYFGHVQLDNSAPPSPLHRSFYEKVWKWVTTHPDIRIFDGEKVYNLSLSELEDLEREPSDVPSTGLSPATLQNDAAYQPPPDSIDRARPSSALSALRNSLRERLLAEDGHAALEQVTAPEWGSNGVQHAARDNLVPNGANDRVPIQRLGSNTSPNGLLPTNKQSDQAELQRWRKSHKGFETVYPADPKFDELPASLRTPRIFASQNRVWQAVTGHSIDLKKVPLMEFLCLCIIASHGPEGIAQPDLVKITGQDKRSVPKRTDSLANKGYIEKKPMQKEKMRTSLCVHKKFVKGGHFLTRPQSIEDVFGETKFIPTGFVYLLHKLLTEIHVVPMRDLRTRMGVPVKIWHARGVRGAIARLEQTEFVKRVLAPSKGSRRMLVCVKLLRDPTEDDFKNLKFKRNVPERAEPEDLLEEDAEGDGLDRDIDLTLLEDADSETDGHFDDDYRIPPQWTPDRLVPNLIVEAAEKFGVDGNDTAELRDITMGKFWKRPFETFLARIVDHWEKSQPPHLRHLAIVKDTTVTNDKKFAHYLYRTYRNFQKAVDINDANWEGVSREAHARSSQPKKKHGADQSLDDWGFLPLNPKDFVRQTGTSTLADSCRAIVQPHRGGTHWDNTLWKRITNDKPERRKTTNRSSTTTSRKSAGTADVSMEPFPPKKVRGRKKQQSPGPTITLESDPESLQAQSPDVSPSDEHREILKQRQETGRPTANPVESSDEADAMAIFKREGPTLTAAERVERGLPSRGRLPRDLEDQIRREKGLTLRPSKPKKPRPRYVPTDGPLLTPDQRKAKGLARTGRLPEKIVAELRRLRNLGLDPFSIVLPLPGDIKAGNTFAQGLDANAEEVSKNQEVPVRVPSFTPSAEPLADTPLLSLSAAVSSPVSSGSAKKRIASPLGEHLQRDAKRLRTGAASTSSDAPRNEHPTTRAQTGATIPASEEVFPTSTLDSNVTTPASDHGISVLGSGKDLRTSTPEERLRASASGQIHESDAVPSRPSADAVIESVEVPTFTSAQSSRPSRRKRKEPKVSSPQVSFEVEVQSRQVGRNFADTSEVGFYYDGQAKRLGGRGRPRNAFMGIIKSMRLADFSWFTADPDTTTIIRYSQAGLVTPAQAHELQLSSASAREPKQPRGPNTNGRLDFRSEEHPETVLDADETTNLKQTSLGFTKETSGVVGTQSPIMTEPESPRTQSDAPSENITQLPVGGGPQVSQEKQSTNASTEPLQVPTSRQTAKELSQDRAQRTIVNDRGEVDHLAPVVEQRTAAVKSPDGATPSTQEDLQINQSPTSSTYLNLRSDLQSAGYQSPYAPHLTPLPTTVTNSDQFDSPAPTNVSIVEPEPRQEKQDEYNKRGVVIGRGNVYRIRTSIVRDILEMCNGVFPHNGEIINVYGALWKERAPRKMACPERGTMQSTLNRMLNDPNQNLRQYTFTFAASDGRMANRAIFAYKHLDFHSLEVQNVFQGIRQTHPNKYYPPGIRAYVSEERRNKPAPIVTEVDDSIELPEAESLVARRLAKRIRDAAERRDQEIREKQRESIQERQNQEKAIQKNKRVARTHTGRTERPHRTRLVGLNVAGRPKQWRFISQPKRYGFIGQFVIPQHEEPDNATEAIQDSSYSSEDIPLAHFSRRRSLDTISSTSVASLEVSSSSESDSELPSAKESGAVILKWRLLKVQVHTRQPATGLYDVLVRPSIRFHPSSGTFSTEFNPRRTRSSRARVKIPTVSLYDAFVRPSSCFYPSNGTFSTDFSPTVPSPVASTTSEKGPKRTREKPPHSKRPTKRFRRRKRADDDGEATLVQRLTGLTGNAVEPDYQPPLKKQKTFPTWAERKETRRINIISKPNDPKYAEVLDPVDIFKKLLCTLVVASSMSGEDGIVDWDIVKKVCNDPRAEIPKMKQVWSWMQENMTTQLSTFTSTFQSAFLGAYEEGRVASIDDPATYDWPNLVRWAMQHCDYIEPLLPSVLEALDHYSVDLSDYQIFNRPSWYKNNIASIGRSRNLHDYAFAAPLHSVSEELSAAEEKNIRARSWIRANVSTPQELYNKKLAFDKLRPLGEGTLEGAVKDLVNAQLIRKWKLKRLRPGRNYEFTSRFAMKYRRAFELKDFIAAAELKKILDLTFASGHAFTISRTAHDGAVMAILSLVSDGQIKLVPRLPPTNNVLKAPRPRISVWGFNEGDYVHRKMGRDHLFWQVDAIPTSNYMYGNPLQPAPFPRLPKADGSPADWEYLPDPPLPSRDDPHALLPIWSSIDGQHVIYPWWNRILNLVIQSLMFQPGATASEIFSHCPKFTTELFEVELVIYWLEQIKAVKQTPSGTYSVQQGFWAVFGDKLIDEENDKFGEDVKRKNKSNRLEPSWRTEYNQRFATLQQENGTLQEGTMTTDDEASAPETTRPMTQQILQNSKSQYRIAKQALQAPPAPKSARRKVGRPRKIVLPPVAPPIDPALIALQPAQGGGGDVDMAYAAPAPAPLLNAAGRPAVAMKQPKTTTAMKQPRKRKRAADEGDGTPKPKRKRGRPKKVRPQLADPDANMQGEDIDAEGEVDEDYGRLFS